MGPGPLLISRFSAMAQDLLSRAGCSVTVTPKSFPVKPRRARHATLAVMLALLMVGGAACGGGGGGPLAAKSTSTTTTAASGALAAFRQCMISHGIPAAAVPTGRGR